jgi:4-hydroxy-2-oxoheptanedioate aldolase
VFWALLVADLEAAGLIVLIDGAMHDAVPAIAALGVTPLVRLPDVQSWMVKRESS